MGVEDFFDRRRSVCVVRKPGRTAGDGGIVLFRLSAPTKIIEVFFLLFEAGDHAASASRTEEA